MISDDPYRTSTQYRLFSFASPEDLLAQRTRTNTQSTSQLPPDSATSYLTVTEEIELIDFYVGKLWDLCRLFKVPSHVKVPPLPLFSHSPSPFMSPFFALLPRNLCLTTPFVGNSNILPPPLLPPLPPFNNPPKTPNPNNSIPRLQNRKHLHSPRIFQTTASGISRFFTIDEVGISSE